MDSQAQDRCHRIGQTKNVFVYRLATAGSVEAHILQRANAKRSLERVLAAGGFNKAVKGEGKKSVKSTVLDLILDDDIKLAGKKKLGEGISDEELATVLDRKGIRTLLGLSTDDCEAKGRSPAKAKGKGKGKKKKKNGRKSPAKGQGKGKGREEGKAVGKTGIKGEHWELVDFKGPNKGMGSVKHL